MRIEKKNGERERERERERWMMFATIASWVAKKSIIVVIAKPKKV